MYEYPGVLIGVGCGQVINLSRLLGGRLEAMALWGFDISKLEADCFPAQGCNPILVLAKPR